MKFGHLEEPTPQPQVLGNENNDHLWCFLTTWPPRHGHSHPPSNDLRPNSTVVGSFQGGCFQKYGYPQNGWFIMETLINMDDLGVAPFSETSKVALLSTWLLPTDLDEKQNAAALTPEEAGVNRGGVGMAGSVLPGRPHGWRIITSHDPKMRSFNDLR